MALSGLTPTTTAMILLMLVVYFCPRTEMVPALCNKLFTNFNSYCHHNQSGLCGFRNSTVPLSCTHQLRHRELTSDMTAAECQVELFDEGKSFHISWSKIPD
ncbi:hypothetical protein E2C01_029820 [Portunus trituberculatus]|uniref:Uncharacterized protein n=1 Tax=Portunus trituberculatus TaxID=210409 RepID=A0A5B7EQC1_PORTR|nr:hypothetical protein [Portunus trituberculatus]